MGGKRTKKLISNGGERRGSDVPPIAPLVCLNSEETFEVVHQLFDGSALGGSRGRGK